MEHKPIRMDYTLTGDEVYQTLKQTKRFHKSVIKAVIETVVLAALTLLFGIWWLVWGDGNAMIFCIACGCLIGLVWAVIIVSTKGLCAKFTTGDLVTLLIYGDKIETGDGRVYPLNGTLACKKTKNLLLLSTAQGEWTVIPLRAAGEQAEQVKQRILAGSKEI